MSKVWEKGFSISKTHITCSLYTPSSFSKGMVENLWEVILPLSCRDEARARFAASLERRGPDDGRRKAGSAKPKSV